VFSTIRFSVFNRLRAANRNPVRGTRNVRFPRPLLALTILLFVVITACSRGPHYNIAIVGDIQQPGEGTYREATREIGRQIASSDAQFVVFVGDLISGGGQGQWDEFDRLVQPIRDAGKPIYSVIGNHDAAFPEGFEARFPRRQVIHLPGLALVMLDSEAQSEERNWALGDAQTKWLQSKPWTAEATAPHPLLFFFVHRPPHRSKFFARLDPGFRFQPEKTDVAKLLTDLGADAVFSGHEHLYSRQDFDGVDFIISGGGGGDLLLGDYHYLMITVYPASRRWTLKVVKVKSAGKPVYARSPFDRQ